MQQNLNLTESVSEFVKELNGRYKEFICDELLIAWIERDIVYQLEVLYATQKQIEMTTIAYYIGCYIFELHLENRLNAGGNGHHVASDLASKFA